MEAITLLPPLRVKMPDRSSMKVLLILMKLVKQHFLQL
jgi:hypothetical protein